MAITNWLIVASISGLLTVEPRPEADAADAYIRTLLPQERLELIVKYSASAFYYSGFIKFQQPPKIFIRCQNDDCAPKLLGMLAVLRERVPGVYGEQVAEPEAAQIEVYVASEPQDFDRRDRLVDETLHVDAHVGSKFLLPPQPAPCRATIYFDHKRALIEKTMIFIDHDASERMQYLCMGFELVRALGVISLPAPLFYEDLEKRSSFDPLSYLAANMLLHKSREIEAGDPMKKALAILKDRYGVQ